MNKSSSKQIGVVLPAGGSSTRFPGETKKQFRTLHGKPLLLFTLERVLSTGGIDIVTIAVPEKDISHVVRLVQPFMESGVEVHVVKGGDTRQASVVAALATIPKTMDIVVVHDAVRPLLEPQWITASVELCNEYDGAIVAIPATDTLKEILPSSDIASLEHLMIQRTLARETVWHAQTPQTFRSAVLRQALTHAHEHGLVKTDESSLVEAIGGRVAIVRGSPHNIKVTTAEDWQYLEWRMDHD
ncbi:2-C-methyl-D-erythritol 4-phosphate cytidylyltransferase [Candidatus Neomarinimicrobiota bacterium]